MNTSPTFRLNITAVALLLALQASASSVTDSLYSVWLDTARPDTVRLQALHDYTREAFLYSDPDSAVSLSVVMFDHAKQKGLERFMAGALNLQGQAHANTGELDLALDAYARSLRIMEALGDKRGVGRALINTGTVLSDQGNYTKALEAFERGLAVVQESGPPKGVFTALVNIGIIHEEAGNNALAMDYYLRGYAIATEMDDVRSMAVVLHNMAVIDMNEDRIDTALQRFTRSYEMAGSSNELNLAANGLNSIGFIHLARQDTVQAIQFFQRALTTAEGSGYILGTLSALVNLGGAQMTRAGSSKAIACCSRARATAQKQGLVANERDACECLYKAYRLRADAPNALINLERFRLLDDSLHETETAKKLQRIEFSKEALADSLANVEEMRSTQAAHASELKRQRIVRNGFMVGFVLVALFAGVFLFQRNRIGKEKKRSEELLLNILPEEVAEELKAKGEAEARQIDQVTVLFTDFKGFTAMSEQLTPKELVRDIHECFSAFDRIMAKHGIEKIKTIGDAYMAAGGLPTPNKTHALDVVKAALEIRDFIAEGKALKIAKGLPYFEIRIGVHTGPVVAGIVGVKKFAYDIWGDTVNTASRMESSGEVGQVNISESTYALVKDEPGLTFTPRGRVHAKGKGEMEMYFVTNT